jgi:hypothetical protein
MNNINSKSNRILGRVLSKEQTASVAGGIDGTSPSSDSTASTDSTLPSNNGLDSSNTIAERSTLTMFDGVFFLEN